MKVTKLFTTDERAVSPVVGVALLIAIAVILAAVIGAVVLGLGTGGVDTPTAQLQLNDNASAHDNSANITHNGGEPLDADEIVVSVNGDADYVLEDDLTAGGSVLIWDEDGTEAAEVNEGDEVVILWQDPNSDSESVLERFDV